MVDQTRNKVQMFLYKLGVAFQEKEISKKELTDRLISLIKFLNNSKGHKKL